MTVISFESHHAERYGVEAAVIIYNFLFWIKKNEANENHFHDGRYWTYNSAKAFCKIYPFWTKSKIYRLISYLEKENVLLKGNFNGSNYNRTSWYAFSDEFIAYHNGVSTNFPLKAPETSNFHICNMEVSDSQHGSCRSEKCKTDIYNQIYKDKKKKKNYKKKKKADPQESKALTLSKSTDATVTASTARRAATHLPDDWQPSQDCIAYAQQKGLSYEQIQSQAEQFRNYWHSQPTSRAKKTCWKRTWYNWVARYTERFSRHPRTQLANGHPFDPTGREANSIAAISAQADDLICRQQELKRQAFSQNADCHKVTTHANSQISFLEPD